ncbi:MAG: hypothetical protein CM1200mP10_33330 [Candidatus Neomarinimicrobiota bacterium]|nr:MAG: hypothetical protein CM1200mP10_33330 [Candidatus Neomarinimicrobiota bacterium]
MFDHIGGRFNLVSTLVLVIIQKIREIGILRAIGTSKINIKKIILTQRGF